jgi:UDP-N-acetylglucosamine--N-acetylmuramyl-(pentapeptide) pyrophosphoryl-undecaprenol N-acetylglucosamine transferase
MFARSAVKLALNFAETANVPGDIKDKIIIAGTPVRKDLKLNKKKDNKAKLKDSTIHIFVLGGSQAAQIFSEIIPAAIEIVHEKAPDIKVKITQQAKLETLENLRNRYKLVTESAVVEEFFYDVVKSYNSADLVISRSGASTIAELISTGTPAIMIPFPGAAEDHQTYNARALVSKNAGWLYEQSGLTPAILADKIIDIVRNPKELQNVSSNLLKLALPSERILGDTVEKIING